MPAGPTALRRLLSWSALARGAGGVVSVYSLIVLALLAFEDRLLYHPAPASRRWFDPPPGVRCEDVELADADGTRLHARWFPRDDACGAVLVCHSRAGNVTTELTA